jgi:hypothetical protein
MNVGHDLAYVDAVVIPQQLPQIVYIYGRTAGSPQVRKAYRSIDGGESWSQIADSPGSTNWIAARPGEDTRYALAGGVVYKSVDGSAWSPTLLGSYTNPPGGFFGGQTYSVKSFALPRSAGSQRIWFLRGPSPNSDGTNRDNHLHYTDDEGASWFGGFGGFGGGAGYNLFASADPNRAYMGYGSGALYGFDLTSPRTATSFAVSGPTYAANGTYVSNTKDHVVAFFPQRGMYVSENGGASFAPASSPLAGGSFVFDPAAPQTWWLSAGASAACSTDNGLAWIAEQTGFAGALSLALG